MSVFSMVLSFREAAATSTINRVNNEGDSQSRAIEIPG